VAESKSQRKLAAIMFTDVVGYTGMMQADEQSAIAVVKRHEVVLETAVAEFKGKILQYYGDGSLTIFESASQALKCAIRVQQDLQKELKVPLRIGLHSGEIVNESGKYFGDGLNIASRIEQAGTAGAILCSSHFSDLISNKKEFNTVSLGSFQFKNVRKPLEVFAIQDEGITVPSKEDLQKNIKTAGGSGSKVKLKRLLRPALLLVVAVAAIVWIWTRNLTSNNPLPDSIQNARIAVVPFENRTNDPDLDMVGDMAADWITQGLINLENVKVVSYQTIKDYQESTGALMSIGDPEFMQTTGAEKVIQGNYYLEDDQLIFQSQIVDPKTGEIEIAIPPVTGERDRLSACVGNLEQRLSGYFVAASDKAFWSGIRNPPKLEAYRLFWDGTKYFGFDYEKTAQICSTAMEIDSQYYWIYNRLFFCYANQGDFENAAKVLELEEKRFPRMNKIEKLYNNYKHATLARDLQQQITFAREMYEFDPKNWFHIYISGSLESALNHTVEALKIFSSINLKSYFVKAKVFSMTPVVKSYCLMRMNRLDEALETLNIVPYELALDFVFQQKARIYALMGQTDSIQVLISQIEGGNYTSLANIYLVLSESYALAGDDTNQIYWAGQLLQHIEDQAPENIALRAQAKYYLGNDDEALRLYQELNETSPSAFNLARMGYIQIRQGNLAAARACLKDIDSENRFVLYDRAKLLAHLGEKEEAVATLKKAFEERFFFHPGRYDQDPDLLPLHGFVPYEEFVRPK
jgi:class 3 adenylate cyclase/tetratricopeptide (TPR) repeat protein